MTRSKSGHPNQDDPPSASGFCSAFGAAVHAVARFGDGPSTGLGLGGDYPNPLDRLATDVFIGREREMRELRAGLETALAGRGRLVLLAGEPGIGKTRCAEELCADARGRGVEVLVGRCYEGEGAPAFRPWVQILRAFLSGREFAGLKAEEGGTDIAKIMSHVCEEKPGGLPSITVERSEARFRLFDNITRFLKKAASQQALLLVLDDLHWADKPSLLLLQFLARDMAQARVLLVGTYRDVDVGRHNLLSHTLGELAREPACRRLLLGGFTEREVARYVEAATGIKPAPALVARVSSTTEGNPFFVGEIVRLLWAEGELEQTAKGAWWRIKLPQGVREVVTRRLDHLSTECRRILALASIIGRDFRFELLMELSKVPHGTLLELLEEAAAAHLISEAPRALCSYRFSHALIRETLYEEIPLARRVSLHREIGQALETLYACDPERHVAALAYHFFEAARGGRDVDKAITYARRAGERAAAQLAYEDAAGHFERALIALEARDPRHSILRCDLLLALAEAQQSAGDGDGSREIFLRAAEIARRLGARDRLAVAALGLGLGFLGFEFGVLDEALVCLLEEALAAFPQEDSVVRVRLLSNLAMALYWSAARPRSAALSAEAVDMARRLGDPVTLAIALHGRHWALWGVQDPRERLASASEIVRLATEAGDAAIALTGHAWRLTSLAELGEAAAMDAEIEEIARLERKVRQPRFLWLTTLWRAMRSLLSGRFEEAERLTHQVLAMAPNAQDSAAAYGIEQAFGVQMLVLLRERARLEELEPQIKGFAERYPTIPGWRCALAWLYAELGREAEAREELERLTDHLGDLPRDINWLAAMALLAEACAFLRDPERAARLYELLLPHGERCIVVSFAVACFGSVSRYLGLLASTMSHWTEAVEHFARGLEIDARLGAQPWVVRGQLEYARVLLVRGQPGDRERALELLAVALDKACEFGARALIDSADGLRERAHGEIGADVRTSIDAVAQLVRRTAPDLGPFAGADGTLTIMFTDVEGFAAGVERLGEERAQAVLHAHTARVREAVAALGGVEVEHVRDGFMVGFAHAQQALACSVAIQRAVRGYSERHPIEPLRVRIGLHACRSTDEVAETVMAAARIAARARGGEIMVSAPVRDFLAPLGGFDFTPRRGVRPGGTSGSEQIYLVRWENEARVGEAVMGAAQNVFLREGEYWTLSYAGTVCRLRDTKGLRHIAHLLRHPGRELTALELAAAAEGQLGGAAAPDGPGGIGTCSFGDAGALLDAKAKADYRQRLRELSEELAEAEGFNDLGRVARLKAEIDMLAAQLTAAVGLGGRDRRAASAAERSRLTVTKRIKDALTKIHSKHPILAQHLALFIKTGYRCMYTPDTARGVDWVL